MSDSLPIRRRLLNSAAWSVGCPSLVGELSMTAAQQRLGDTPRLFACVDFVAVASDREAMFPFLATLLDPLSNPPTMFAFQPASYEAGQG